MSKLFGKRKSDETTLDELENSSGTTPNGSIQNNKNALFSPKMKTNKNKSRVSSLMERHGNKKILFLAFFFWYFASTICNSSSRKILQRSSNPLHLCLLQFLITFVLGTIYFYFVRRSGPVPIPVKAQLVVLKLSMVYTVGFVFVNAGYVVIHVSLAETLRSAEPIVSVILAICFLQDDEPISWYTVLSMIPIVLGGALSSYGDGSITPMAFLFVLISNICFSLRSVYAKQLGKLYEGDSVCVFYEVTRVGTIALLMLTILFEALFASTLSQHESLSLAPFLTSYLQSETDDRWINLAHEMVPLVLLNGASYALYNLMSYVVLARVEMVTHAVGNAFRRVVTILASVWYFQNVITSLNALGIILAFSGVTLYTLSKAYGPSRGMKTTDEIHD